MKVLTTSAILVLCAVESCLAQIPVVQFFIGGRRYPYEDTYTVTVPQDGSTVAITNPIEVYTILSSDTAANCTFTGATGQIIPFFGSQIDILVQPLVSVTCLARSGPVVFPTYFSSFFPSLVTVTTPATSTSATASVITPITSAANPITATSAAGTGGSAVPPYPLSTGGAAPLYPISGYPYIVVSSSGSAPSAVGPSGTASPTGGNNAGNTAPFTGAAAKTVQSIGGSLFAFLGLIAVL